jgi:hypothetical protein
VKELKEVKEVKEVKEMKEVKSPTLKRNSLPFKGRARVGMGATILRTPSTHR